MFTWGSSKVRPLWMPPSSRTSQNPMFFASRAPKTLTRLHPPEIKAWECLPPGTLPPADSSLLSIRLSSGRWCIPKPCLKRTWVRCIERWLGGLSRLYAGRSLIFRTANLRTSASLFWEFCEQITLQSTYASLMECINMQPTIEVSF